MPRDSFFDEAVKRRTTDAIRTIEEQTSAEVVVAVRPRASWYFPTTVVAASVAASLAFAVMWWSPVVYDVRTIPIDVALTFVVVAAVVHLADRAKRWLTPRRTRAEAMRRLAAQLFSELRIDATAERTGMLVCVSLFEREALLMVDQGIRREAFGTELDGIETELTQAVRRRDVAAFLAALLRLGPLLGKQLPRRDDDVNELSDTVA